MIREIVRVGFNVISIVLLVALVCYIAVQLWVTAIKWAVAQ